MSYIYLATYTVDVFFEKSRKFEYDDNKKISNKLQDVLLIKKWILNRKILDDFLND